MAWKVDLRDDSDAESRGIGDDVFHLILSVVAAVADAVVAAPVLLDDGAVPERADLGELRVLLDLHPPALVIGKMPVEAVELVDGHDVQIPLNLLDREEMPGAVKVHSPVGEARLVLDLHAREEELLGRIRLAAEHLDTRELLKGLNGIEETVERGGFDHAATLVDGD